MNTIYKYFLTLAAAAAFAPAVAQDLSTEVVVDRSVVPEEKAATRPASLAPVVSLPPVEMPSLQTIRFTTLSPLTRGYARLDAADGAFAAEKSPWRGYAVLGYFPLVNGHAAAGYRLLDTNKICLDASFAGEATRYTPKDGYIHHLQFYDLRFGIDGAWHPAENNRLAFNVGYDFLNQKSLMWEMQGVSYVDMSARWDETRGRSSYFVKGGAAFEMPGNTIVHPELNSHANDVIFFQPYQQRYSFAVGGSVGFAGTSAAGIEAGVEMVHTGNCMYNSVAITSGGTAGYAYATPAYTLSAGNIFARVGLKLSMGVGDLSGKKFRVAPDINIQWSPSQTAALWIKVDGGERAMTFHDMRQYSPFQIFIYETVNSNVPYSLTGGVDFHPLKGFTVSASGGYAKADSWYLLSTTVPSFRPVDISGWTARLALEYQWRFIKAAAEATIAPGDYAHAWLENRDRARTTIGASIEAAPIAPLTVGVAYRGRLDRSCYDYIGNKFSLGDVADVSLYASWRFNPRLSVFGRCDNLLGHRYLEVAQIISAKQTGAVGVAVKF